MSVEAISAVGAQVAVIPPTVPVGTIAPAPDAGALAAMSDLLANPAVANGEGVFDRLVSSLGDLDARMRTNARAATELALGQSENLHQVLVDAERTRLQFDLAMSMRNRVLEAYQEIMRMQV
jgi:flagellar hook-basal body complex protein FliE